MEAKTETESLAAEEVAPDVFRLPLAIPFDVGPVNAYLLRGGARPLLIDVGPRTRGAAEALARHLGGLGLGPGDIADVVITHAHVDHHGGLGPFARARPDLRVHVHEDDADEVAHYQRSLDRSAASALEAMRFWGLPAEALAEAARFREAFRHVGEDIDPRHLVRLRGDRAALEVEGLTLTAIHSPGHCEGQVALLLEPARPGAPRLLFSSDHVLERITPNPALYHRPYRGRRTGLAHYIGSLERLRGLDVDRVLPGHGRAFGGLDRRLDEILEHHRERAAAVLARVREAPRSIFELIQLVWPGLDQGQFYLACREIHGHLDLLIDAGEARVEDSGGPEGARFHATATATAGAGAAAGAGAEP